MLNALYTIKRKFGNKKIYVWDMNRDSMIVFANAVFRRINIHGFVTLQKEYVGKSYMNRPVVSLEQVERDRGAIILVSDEVMESKFDTLPVGIMVRWSDALEFDEELRKRKIIVYGTGWGAGQLRKVLTSEGVKAELYCVTRKNSAMQQYQGVKVIEASELEEYQEYAVIISLVMGQNRQDVLETLVDYKGQIYVEHFVGEVEIQRINLIQSINWAIENNKKIYLYSKRSVFSKLVEESLSTYGVRISGYVYDTEDEERDLKSIYSVALIGTDDKMLIINEESPQRLIAVRENVEFAGFSLEDGSYTGLQWYTRAREVLMSELCNYYDPLVGYSNIFTQNEPGTKLYGKPGWKIYGKEEEGRIRILILGGSTSAEVWHPENWVSKLFNKLERHNIRTTIYNGAHEGNDIVDEMLRLLRDGHVLQPHIVISMSGVNNTHYKDSDNLFNEEYLIEWIKNFSSDKEYCSGVYSDESLYSFWSRNMKLLGRLAEFYGARFLGFLQPMNITMNQMSLQEKSLYESEVHIEGSKEFAKSAKDGEGYINLMKIFEHRDEMYFDTCHYTDRGHEIIADAVYELVTQVIDDLDQSVMSYKEHK